MASDVRLGTRELYETVAVLEHNSDTTKAEFVIGKVRAKWVLWVLQRSRQVGHDQALTEAPPLPRQVRLPDDEADLFGDWKVPTEPSAGILRAYDRSGHQDALEQLTANLTRRAGDEASVSDAVGLQQTGVRWLYRYQQTHETTEFATAVALLDRAIASFPPRHIGVAYTRVMLADAYTQRWSQEGDRRHAREATRLLGQAAPELPADDMFWPQCMIRLGGLLLHRFETEGDFGVLAEGIQVIDRICTEPRADLDTWLAGVNLRLHGLLRQLAAGTPAEPHLDDLQDLVTEAVLQAEASAPGASLADRLTAIGQRCREVHQWTADERYLGAAVAASRSALRLSPGNQEVWWFAALELGASLIQVSLEEAGTALSAEALGLLETALSEAPQDWHARLELLQAQAAAAGRHFEATAEPQWAELGLRAGRAALAMARRQGRHVCTCAVTLAQQLTSLHGRTGDPAELDEAIGLLEEASALASQEQRTLAFNGLGIAVARRFGFKADIRDLDAAISAFETAVQTARPGDPNVVYALSNLSHGFAARFSRTRDPAFLDQAVEILEEALRQVPSPGGRREFLRARLAGTLLERSRVTGESADLERCLELSSAVLADEGHLHRDTLMTARGVYGNALIRHYRNGGPVSDLDRAIGILESAAPEVRSDAVNGPHWLRDLAFAYQKRYELNGANDDLERGVACYTESIKSAMVLDPPVALDAARLLGHWSAERGVWPEAADAYGAGLAAIDRLVAIQSLRGHKESWLRDAQMLPALAAYALVRSGRLEDAVLALENGQALLLNEALEQGRPNLARLRAEGHGALADRYTRAAARISALQNTGPTFQAPAFRQPAVTDPHEARSTMDDILDEITVVSRSVLAAVTLREVTDASAEGPLVYVTFSPWGGAALLVERTGAVHHIPLPSLTYTALRDQLRTYMNAYSGRTTRPMHWRASIEDVTRWLWTALMEPIIDQGYPAATVIPTGFLWLLPLHLAWRPDNSLAGRRYALDDMLLLFAPNARTLNRETNTIVQSILIVENPDSSLRYAREEAEGALRYFADDQCEHLRGAEATRSRVLAALGDPDCLHFACHGRAALGKPLESELLLSDTKLKLGEIMAGRIMARLVVLSACETAMTGIALPDEVVGLPVAFLQAGATGVIGSLWAVPDETTATLMARFYQFWQGEGEPPAQALRKAQQHIRDEIAKASGPEAAHPYSWGAFVYVGR